jgi:hypothetical protein
MSIEIRRGTEGHCECPGPHPADYQWRCRHWWECDWGRIDNSEADPKLGLRHLMLVTGDYVQQLLNEGPREHPRGGIHSATVDGERIFAHLDYDGQRTTWELFEAHFEGGKGPADLMLGRWPD